MAGINNAGFVPLKVVCSKGDEGMGDRVGMGFSHGWSFSFKVASYKMLTKNC